MMQHLKEKDIEPYLTEYRALREEQKTRFTMNSSMLNFILLIVGAEIAAYAQMAMNGKQNLFIPILLGTPLLTTPIALFYYDNTIMIYRIGRYFSTKLYPSIEKVVGYQPFEWERFHQETSGQLVLMSFGRNLFFLLITFGPILISIILKLSFRGLIGFFSSPKQSWQLLTTQMESWELWLLAIDVTFLTIVVAAWAHSGLYFLEFSPGKMFSRIRNSLKKHF